MSKFIHLFSGSLLKFKIFDVFFYRKKDLWKALAQVQGEMAMRC